MKDILWIMPPKKYARSGVYKYSQLIKDEIPNISSIHLPDGIFRYPFQFLILPIMLIFSSLFYKKMVLSEESLSFLIPFFLREKIIIIHDVRDVKTVITIKEKLKAFYIKFTEHNIKLADKVVCVSHFTRNILLNKFKGKLDSSYVSVVYNAIDLDSSEQSESVDTGLKTFIQKSNESNAVLFLYVGSDESRKNTFELVKALDFIANETSQKVSFLRMGRPIDEKNFNNVKNFLIEPTSKINSLLLREVTASDLEYAFRHATLFVMPSTFEGFGRTPVEAQSYGLPVISTDAASLSEVLNDSCIKISSPYQAEQIITAINSWFDLQDKKSIIDLGYINCSRFSRTNVIESFKEFVF